MSHLRRLRFASGLSQSALAAALDIDQSLISRYENGERIPSRDIVEQITTVCLTNIMENIETVRDLTAIVGPEEEV